MDPEGIQEIEARNLKSAALAVRKGVSGQILGPWPSQIFTGKDVVTPIHTSGQSSAAPQKNILGAVRRVGPVRTE